MIIRFIMREDRIELCYQYLENESLCNDIELVCNENGCKFYKDTGFIKYTRTKSQLYDFLQIFSGWYDLSL